MTRLPRQGEQNVQRKVQAGHQVREYVHRFVVHVAEQRRTAFSEGQAFALGSSVSVLDELSVHEVVRMTFLLQFVELAQCVNRGISLFNFCLTLGGALRSF